MGSWSAGITADIEEGSTGDEDSNSASTTTDTPSTTTTEPTTAGTTTTTGTMTTSTSTTSASTTATSSAGEESGTTGLGSSGSEDTGTVSSACDGIAGESLIPPSDCDGPNGNTTTEIPPNNLYSTSWFGCYFNPDGSIHTDPSDNCEFACGNQGLCPASQSGPECEANLKWFAADADRYGCGGRIRVTNCDNGNSVILTTLDRGPNCNSVEGSCNAPVLDMSHDAMVYLFDGGEYGGCDHQNVVVEEVAAATPLGPE